MEDDDKPKARTELLCPANNFIIIEPETLSSVIYTPTTLGPNRSVQNRGKIVAVGPGKSNEDCTVFYPLAQVFDRTTGVNRPVRVGDFVIAITYEANILKFEGQQYWLLEDGQVMCLVSEV